MRPQIDGATAVHWAVYKGDIEMLDTPARRRRPSDVKNREGVTPLHMASLYGNAADDRQPGEGRREMGSRRVLPAKRCYAGRAGTAIRT